MFPTLAQTLELIGSLFFRRRFQVSLKIALSQLSDVASYEYLMFVVVVVVVFAATNVDICFLVRLRCLFFWCVFLGSAADGGVALVGLRLT